MKCIPFNRELAHLDLADADSGLVGALVEGALDLETGLGRGPADQLDYGGPALQRLLNIRCSILFHFEVPGG